MPPVIESTGVYTIEQIAAALQIGVRSAERMPIPCFYLGTRTRRYLGSAVLAFLSDMEQAA